MGSFFDRFGKSITGVLSGFDRLVFRGHLRSLVYPRGMFQYLCDRKVLLKDFTDWAKPKTEALKERFARDAEKAGHPVVYLRGSSALKRDIVRQAQQERGITDGVIGSWSCVEPCRSWTIRRNRATKHLEPAIEPSACLHLYRYWDDERFGFMHARLQTWFPFSIQIGMNGREYLRRSLERHGVGHQMSDNCFTGIADWDRAQRLSDRLLAIDWPTVLDGIAQRMFPDRRRLIGDFDYQWSAWQTEWATDHAFTCAPALDALYPALEQHAILTSNSATVLRYLGRHVTIAGMPHGKLEAEVTTRLSRRVEGTCIHHRVGGNEVKMYNKQGSVLRVETTINDPGAFTVMRTMPGSAGRPKPVPMRKSVADLKRRARASQQVNERYLEHQAAASMDRPLSDITMPLARRTRWHGDSMRGLDLTGKDRVLIDFLCEPEWVVNGLRNADLRTRLRDAGLARGKSDRQVAAMATRQLRLMRAHGLIRKMPRSQRYQVTPAGRLAAATIKSALSASVQQLTKIAA